MGERGGGQGACVIGAAARSEPLNVHLHSSHFHLQDFFFAR